MAETHDFLSEVTLELLKRNPNTNHVVTEIMIMEKKPVKRVFFENRNKSIITAVACAAGLVWFGSLALP